ncbi:membrane protein [Gordonia phage Widow]|nr:membrane protein [Gordonia phage Puppers]UTN93322.1 membrane protein [Gordonia phage Widow]
MNKFFPDVPEPSRRPRSDAAREKLLQVLRVRDATVDLKHKAEVEATRVTGAVTGVVAFVLGVTLANLLGGDTSLGLGELWIGVVIFAGIIATRLPFIRRDYLRALGQIQRPVIGDNRPRSHNENDSGE